MRHLACIMDGNRRWAHKQGLLLALGHQKGADAVRAAIDFCLKNKIAHLSLYTFSLENLNRSDTEKNFLYTLLIDQCKKRLDELQKAGVSVRFVGNRSFYTSAVLENVITIEKATEKNTALYVYVMFCYGGRQELENAALAFARNAIQSGIKAEDLSIDEFKKLLWMNEVPDPELIIRTGGHQRLSNFMPYQSAYSELYFTPMLWPDMKHEHFQEALSYYEQCTRKFGS